MAIAEPNDSDALADDLLKRLRSQEPDRDDSAALAGDLLKAVRQPAAKARPERGDSAALAGDLLSQLRKPRPTSAEPAPPRLPFVATAPGKPRPEEALFTDTPRKKSKPVAIPKIQPINMGGQEPEEAAYVFSQRQFKQLPESLRAPGYTPSEGGRVSQILQGRAQTFQRLKGKRGQIEAQHNQFAQQVMDQQKALNEAIGALNKRGGITSQEKKSIERAQAAIDQNLNRVNQRGQQIKSYWGEEPRVMARVRGLKPLPVHEGPYRPGEKAARERRPISRLASAVMESPVYQFLDPFQQRREKVQNAVPQVRADMMASGKYPPLPPNPGRTPQERSQRNRELADVRRHFFVDVPGEGFIPTGAVGSPQWRQALQQAQATWTPYQKSLVPIFAKQALAEREVYQKAGVGKATITDVGVNALAELIGGKVGSAVVKSTAKLAEPAVRALQKAGVRKWGAEAIARGVPAVGAGAAAGGAGGGAAAGVAVYADTRDPKKALKAAKQAVGPSALVGGVFGAVGAGAETAVAAKGQKKASAATRQMAASTPGPRAKTASGVEVRLRHTDPQALERVAAEYEAQRAAGTLTPEGEQNLDRIRQWQEAQARRDAQLRVDLPSEELGTYQKDWKNPKNPARAQRDQMLAQAEQAAATNPRLSELLTKEADEIHGEFIHDVLRRSERVDLETPNPAAPAQVSVWRQLSPEEQAALPPQLRDTLLMRDIHNSMQVLSPGADAVYRPKDISVRNPADLEAKADQMFIEAQSHLDALYAAPAALPGAPGGAATASLQVTPRRRRQVAPQPEVSAPVETTSPATSPVDVTSPIERAPVPTEPGMALPPREDVVPGQFQGEITGGAQGAAMRAGDTQPQQRPPAEIEAELERVGQRWETVNRQLENPPEGMDDIAGEARSQMLLEALDDLEQQSIDLQAELLDAQTVAAPAPKPKKTVAVKAEPAAEASAPKPKKQPVAKAEPIPPRDLTEEFRPTHRDKTGKLVEFVRVADNQVRVRDSAESGQQYNVPKAFFDKHFKPIDETPDAVLNTPQDVELTANPKSGEFQVVRSEAKDGTVIARTPDLDERLKAHPKAADLNDWVSENAAAIQRVIERVVKKVLPSDEAGRVRHAGVGLLEWNGPVFGANLHNAGDVGGPTEILVTPFRPEEPVVGRTWYNQPTGGDNPRKLAREIVYTSLHEAAHNLVREEGDPLWKTMDRLYKEAGDDFFETAIQEIQHVLTGGKEGGELSPGYRAARSVYLEVAGSAGSPRRADGARAATGAGQAAGASLARGVPGGKPGVRSARKRNRGVDADSLIQDPDLYDSYQKNRVPVPENFKERHLPTFKQWWAGLTRTIPELPNTPEFAPLRKLFREFRSLNDIAAAKRTFVIQEQLSGLSKPEYERLSEAVFLRNMAANVKRQKRAFEEKHGNLNGFEARLPRGWTEAQLNAAMKNADALFAQGGKVKDAYDGLEQARAQITNELKSLYKDVTGKDLKLDLEDYHHQSIIAYARGKGVDGGIKKGGMPGFTKGRKVEGHDLEYYTDFIEHESRWMESAVRKIQTLKLWRTLITDYDITPEVKARLSQLNDKAFLPSLQSLATGNVSPGTVQKLSRLAVDDALPDHVDSRFSDLIDGLEDLEKNGTPLSPELEAMLPEYGKFLTSRTRGKGLGWRPGDKIPEGYVERSVDEISGIFAANAIPQKLAEEAQLFAGKAVGITAEDLRKVMAMGRRKTIIIPKEVSAALDAQKRWSADDFDNTVEKGLRKMMSFWKWEKLLNPERGAGYWIGNAVSDTDATFQGNPRAAKRMPKTAVDVGKFLGGQAPTPILRKWVERAGMQGMLTGVEGVGTGIFGADPLGKYSPRRKASVGRVAKTALSLAEIPHNWREATVRVANFEEFADQILRDIKNGGAGVPDWWGASNPAEVMALKDPYDRAFKLSEDLVLNYAEMTAAGRWLSRHTHPFFSWLELNTRRQLRLYKNAWDSPRIAAAYGKKVAGGPIPVAQAIALGRFAMKAATLMFSMDAWNEYAAPEERKQLGERRRGRPTLFVGRDDKGNAMFYDRWGNTQELLSWFGLDNHGFSPALATRKALEGETPKNPRDLLEMGAVGGYAEAWLNGRMSMEEIAKEMAMAPGKKFASGVGPLKVPFEVATGQNLMDVTDPSPNINRWDPLFNTIGFGLPKLQRYLEGRPARPGQGQFFERPALGYKQVDLSEESYNEMRGYAHEWLAKKGKKRAMAVPAGERGIALYWHKKALKYGDTKTAAVRLKEYIDSGATEDDYVTSLKKLSPLSALSTTEQKEFVESLAADDLERLRRSYIHYQQLVAPEIPAERVARLERIIHAEQPAGGTRSPLEWQRRRTYLWIQRLAEGRTKQAKGMVERHLERHNPLREMAKEDRELKRQLRRNEREKRQARRGR